MAFFRAMAELKQTAQGKILSSQFKYESGPTKSSNMPTTNWLVSLIVKMTAIWATPLILTVSLPSTYKNYE